MAQRFAQNKVLGITVGERSLVVAEASRGGGIHGGGGVVTLAAAFDYPAGTSLDTPGPLGAALAAFLKDNGFSARTAVVGLPARWVLSKPKDVPPAGPDDIAEALRLQVEGEFSQELKGLVFDYAGQTSETEGRTVLLLAVQTKQLEKATALLAAAGLNAAAAVPAGLVLGAATANAGGATRQALVLTAGPAGVELVAHDGQRPQVLRHLGSTSAPPAVLAGELRRAAMGLAATAAANGHANGSANGTNGHASPAITLTLWDAAALGDPARRVLGDAANARVEAGDLAGLGVAGELSAGGRAVASAAALALAPFAGRPLPADFLKSKLAEPKKPRIPRKLAIGIAVGVVTLGAIVFAVTDIWSKQSHLADLQVKAERAKPDVKVAQAAIAKFDFADRWEHDDPQYIACLRDLVGAIPADERGLTYVTDFALTAEMRGSCTVRTDNEQTVEKQVVDHLLANKQFSDVACKMTRQRQQGQTEFVYKLTFLYSPAKPAAPTQPAKKP